MTKKSTPNKSTAFIISWIGLFIFNLMFAHLTTTVPISLTAVFLLFTASALYKERLPMRPLVVAVLPIAIIYIAITYFGSIWLHYEIPNLFDIRAPKAYVIAFYLFSFLNAGAFTAVGMALFKAINKPSTGIILILANAIIYFLSFYLFRDMIQSIITLGS